LSTTILKDPLASIPSVLAIPGIRAQVTALAPEVKDRSEHLRRLLAVDPPTVLRCMRMLGTPCYGNSNPVRSIDQIARRLGHVVIQRAFSVVPENRSFPPALDALWLHAVATAVAARNLALQCGTMDPEEAYLAGLLHDLSQWTHLLQEGSATEQSATDLARRWNLDPGLRQLLDELMLVEGRLGTAHTPATLIRAAETMAEIADFWHPHGSDDTSRELLLSSIGKRELVAARELRLEVRQVLADVGIRATAVDVLPHISADVTGPTSSRSLFHRMDRGSVGDVVLTLLDCNESPTYRGVLTATTSVAIRYLGFDRAFYVVWQPATGRCILRAKSDMSPIGLRSLRILPTNHEQDVLGESFRTGRPLRLALEDDRTKGLLQALGTEEVLVAPMNRNFVTPAFLILDRQLSAAGVDEGLEQEPARSLAGIASLLVENQLLNRRRQRAQRFALVDPLTQLANRAVGLHSLTKEVFRAQRNRLPLTVMMLDMDDFKNLNDTYGHISGDRALRAAAEVLRRQLRRSDTICRYGGEEFLAILPETSAADASVLATRIFIAVAERGDELELPLTVSIGLAELLDPSEPPESLLHRADRALYASKATGRNRFSVDARPQ